jgi:hypothetical protein
LGDKPEAPLGKACIHLIKCASLTDGCCYYKAHAGRSLFARDDLMHPRCAIATSSFIWLYTHCVCEKKGDMKNAGWCPSKMKCALA